MAAPIAAKLVGGAAAQVGQPYLYNFKTSNTRKLNAIKAFVGSGSQPGGSRKSIAFYGDSRDAGIPGETPALGVNGRIASKPTQLAKMLTAFGIPATVDSFFGSSGLADPTAYNVYNSTFAGRGAGWVFTASISLGGMVWANNNITDYLPIRRLDGAAFDTIDVYAIDSAGGRTLNVYATQGGAVVGTVVTTGTGKLKKFTVSIGSSLTEAFLRPNATNTPVNLIGVLARNASTVELEIYNLGRASWRASNLADTTGLFSPLNALVDLKPDFVFCNTATNDGLYAKGLATSAEVSAFIEGSGAGSFRSDYQKIIDAVKGYGGGFAIEVPGPSRVTDQVPQDIQDRLNVVLYQIALANDLPLIDHAMRMGLYVEASVNGLISGGLHETKEGYYQQAGAVQQFIMRT